MSQLAQDRKLIAEVRDQAIAAYAGPALAHKPATFAAEDVYQISEREYFSFDDGLLYYVADNDKRVAMIHMKGLMVSAMGSFDYYASVSDMIKRAESSNYHGALILADSPGGMTKGMRKLNEAIATYSKPIGVWVSGNLNSAAAFVTAGADFILADPVEENSFGSIGVYCMHMNVSKQIEKQGIQVKITRNEGADEKAKPNEFEEWTEEDMARIQESVNQSAAAFHTVMISQRGLSPSQMAAVKLGGEFSTVEAFTQGLHDGTATFEEAIDRLANFQSNLIV
jgi:ClpP class serine protease